MKKLLLLAALATCGMANAQRGVFPTDVYEGTDNSTNKTGIYSPLNLIANPGFETAGTVFVANSKHAPADWATSIVAGFENMGVRADVAATISGKEGKYLLYWRDDNNDKKNMYLYQELTNLEPNKSYKVQFSLFSNGPKSGDRLYYAGAGTTTGGMEYKKIDFYSTANKPAGPDKTVSFEFTTPKEMIVGTKIYFTIKNTDVGDKTNGKGCDWRLIGLDRMTIVSELYGSHCTLDASNATSLTEGNLSAVEQLTLTGEWTNALINGLATALSGNTALTSVDLTAATLTATNATNVFGAVNPNCLVYLADGAAAPTGWKNVVAGTEATNIELSDGKPFNNVKEFTATQISYTRELLQGWSTFCLPFAIIDISNIQEYKATTDTRVTFDAIAAFKANTPYMIQIAEAGTKTFSASSAIVPVTDVVSTDNYKATFKPFAATEATGLYILKADGTAFAKATAAATIPAFRAYFTAIEADAPANYTISYGNNNDGGATSLDGVKTEVFNVYSLVGGLEIISTQVQTLRLYDISGRLVRTLSISEGTTTIGDLASGIYLLNNRKVIVK